MGKDSLFNKCFWENWTAVCKKVKLEYFLILCTKINSKWIKDLNARLETMKLLEESIACTFFYAGLGNTFLDISAQARKTKIDKWYYITLKGFCIAKETINKAKGYLQSLHLIWVNVESMQRTHTTQHQRKNKQPDLKIGRGPE